MNNLVKSIKKLSPKKGDILICTYDGYISGTFMRGLSELISSLKLDSKCLVTPKEQKFKIEKLTQGKHKVYLNNLEYLELLEKRNKT